MDCIRSFIIISVAGAIIGALTPSGNMKKFVTFICSVVAIGVVLGYVTGSEMLHLDFERFNVEEHESDYKSMEIQVAEDAVAREFEAIINDRFNIEVTTLIDIEYEGDSYVLNKAIIKNCPMEFRAQIAEYISCSNVEFEDGGEDGHKRDNSEN